jgi:hypothetical protein
MIVQSLKDEGFVSDKTSCKCKQVQPCANARTGLHKHRICDKGQISTNLFGKQVPVAIWENSLIKQRDNACSQGMGRTRSHTAGDPWSIDFGRRLELVIASLPIFLVNFA